MKKLKFFAISLIGILVLAILGLFAIAQFGGFRLKDPNGNIAFGWSDTKQRVVFMEKPEVDFDGPFVFEKPSGYAIHEVEHAGTDGWKLTERSVTSPGELKVPFGPGGGDYFRVSIRDGVIPAIEDERSASKVLLISDMEGNFHALRDLLLSQRVITSDLRWSYGEGRVVLVGDFVDRGRNMTAILWLIYQLEAEARAAGGAVHFVLGNHEQMALSGNMKYWPSHLRAIREELSRKGLENIYGTSSVLGAWMQTKPVMIRVGDLLITHGGISPEVLEEKLRISQINKNAKAFYSSPASAETAENIYIGKESPLWFRGLSEDPRAQSFPSAVERERHIDRVNNFYGTRKIVMGHTIVPHVGMGNHGKTIHLDIQHSNQTPEAVLIERGAYYRVDARGRREPLGRVDLQKS